MVADTAIM